MNGNKTIVKRREGFKPERYYDFPVFKYEKL